MTQAHPPKHRLNPEQQAALETLESGKNVFLSGAAGCGKSFLLRHFLRNKDLQTFPVLASTGAAAILVGGRTVHSFFGLGIMESGPAATIERALKSKRIVKRLKKAQGLVLDEVSMLSGPVLAAAEAIARKARGNSSPWGGIQVILVGDFFQLPPVNPHDHARQWAFLDPVWEASQLTPVILNRIMRTQDAQFLTVLNEVREGQLSQASLEFLHSRTLPPPLPFHGTKLFPRRDQAEKLNLTRLEQIEAPVLQSVTEYTGKEADLEKFKKNSPIPDVLNLKKGARVMLRQNDPELRFVNGSTGEILKLDPDEIEIRLTDGDEIRLAKTTFQLLDADGEVVATASNFPINLAWAVTIHKAQGATLDLLSTDLRGLWEPGQAYVAMSRVRSAETLFLDGWTPHSFKTDPEVLKFYRNLKNSIAQ